MLKNPVEVRQWLQEWSDESTPPLLDMFQDTDYTNYYAGFDLQATCDYLSRLPAGHRPMCPNCRSTTAPIAPTKTSV